MIFKIDDFRTSDFDLYFKGSIVCLIHPDEKKEWVHYHGYGSGGYFFRREGASGPLTEKEAINRTQIKKYRIDVRFPVGFYNTKQSVVYGERIGARQNTKGLHAGHNYSLAPIELFLFDAGVFKETTSLSKVMRGVQLSMSEGELTVRLANEAFENPKYFTLPEACLEIRSRRAFARAISPLFAITPHHTNKDCLVFYHDIPVAEVVSKTYKVKVLVEDLRPELMHCLQQQGATFL